MSLIECKEDYEGLEKISDIVDAIMEKIKNGEIDVPKNYSPKNALLAAADDVTSTNTKIKIRGEGEQWKPMVQVCSKKTIYSAFMKMILNGLNPGKEQCYFIHRGGMKGRMEFRRMYHGWKAIMFRHGAKDIRSQPVYSEDDFLYSINDGAKKIENHSQGIDSIRNGELDAAYTIIEWKDDRKSWVEVMTIEQIREARESWKDKEYRNTGGQDEDFPAQMAMKTVCNRACKGYFKSSDDSDIAISTGSIEEPPEDEEQSSENDVEPNSKSLDIDEEEDEEEYDDEPFDDSNNSNKKGPDF